ncbi:hypothetical protein E2P81_ATG02062 [Venturia nashicola]|uniref:Uncharacterized protein n=1 Tax=Venturia nashicola TaxID=86259 RepID=A0A4Z1PCU6_9PEZI|nr:hypothetical protein E6O75_ATG02110 [Venturia nashicola]TLD35759.1 hypothetical protein E2P81_ATG02062 [Venturia nashicola]
MPATLPFQSAALNDHATDTSTLRPRPQLGHLRAQQPSPINPLPSNEGEPLTSEVPHPSRSDDAAGPFLESHRTDTYNSSLHTSTSGVTLVHPPVRWRSSESLLVPFITIASPDSDCEAESEDNFTPQIALSHACSDIEREQITAYRMSYHVQEVRDVHEEGEATSRPLFSLETQSHNEVIQRSHCESLLSLRHPIQLLRHIVIPRRNSRRRADLYPSVDSTPQIDAADVSHVYNASRNIGGPLVSSVLDTVDQRLRTISHLDLDNGADTNNLWNAWRDPPTIASSSEEEYSSDENVPTPPSLHSSLSSALDGEDHPLQSNPPRRSADPFLPLSPSSTVDGDDESDQPSLTLLELPSPTRSLLLISSSFLDSSTAQSFTFAKVPAPASTLDASWNAWLASRTPSQISPPESVNSNRSAYFTSSHSLVLPHDHIQQQHRSFQHLYLQDYRRVSLTGRRLTSVFDESEFRTSGRSRSDVSEERDNGEDEDSESKVEPMRIREGNRTGFYLLGARRRSEDGIRVVGDENADSGSGNEMGSSSNDTLFGDSFLNEILARGSAFSFEDLGFFDSRGSLVAGLEEREGGIVVGLGIQEERLRQVQKWLAGDGV